MGYYHRWEDFPERRVSYVQGLTNRMMATQHMMFTRISVKGGATFPRHSHAEEQVLFVLKGHVRVTTGDEPPRLLGPGDIWIVPANVSHGAEYFGDCEALDVTSPLRMDNFAGYTIPRMRFDAPTRARERKARRRAARITPRRGRAA